MATSQNLSLKATPELDITRIKVADLMPARHVGMTVMAVDGTDTVIVIDLGNKCVKSFYKKDGTPHQSKLSLDSYPCGLTKLQNNRVAVTLPRLKQILMVSVQPELEKLSAITTSKRYLGITFLPPLSLAASSQEPPCVDILDMNGTVKRTIGLGPGCNAIIDYPNVLCTTNTGNILVSDGDSKRLVCLKPNGKMLFTYTPPDIAQKVPLNTPEFDAPLRTTSISTGDILVTDFSLNRVFHLTESGEFVGDILTDLMSPIGICEDGDGRVYVLSGGIKVFTLVRQ